MQLKQLKPYLFEEIEYKLTKSLKKFEIFR